MNTEFDVEFELKMKQIINKYLSFKYTTIKNNNPYEYDLELFKYDKNKKQNIIIGYIEIERAIKWKEKYPWGYYSFLERKVYKWNCNGFSNIFKDNYEKTIYLRTNYEGTDMFCLDIFNISLLNKVYEDIWGDPYNDWYFRTSLKDKRIIRGIENCMIFIKNFFEKKPKLEEYM